MHAIRAARPPLARLCLLITQCLAVGLLSLCWAPQASAASCSAWVNGSINFGTIDLLTTPTVDTTPTVLNYGCSANPGDKVLVCVGLGPTSIPSSSTNPRYLIFGSGSQPQNLAFNLYTDAARTQIWGDFGQASYQAQPFLLQFGSGVYYITNTVTFYGRIKAMGQTSVPAGQYQTNPQLPVNVRYATYTGSTPPSCNDPSLTGGGGNSIYIQAVVAQDCRIDSVSTLDFGTVFQTLNQNVDNTATINVLCNGNANSPGSANAYTVTLGYGNQPNGQQRRMTGPNGGLLNYNLYLDSARTQAWGNTAQTGYQGTSNGQSQSITVYGRVPAQPVPGAGVYTDTVIVTMTY